MPEQPPSRDVPPTSAPAGPPRPEARPEERTHHGRTVVDPYAWLRDPDDPGTIPHLEGCIIHDGALVGSGSVVLHHAVVESGALVGAGAVVSGGTVVPARAMALGIPAKIRPDSVTPEMISLGMQSYVHRSRRYRAELRRID